MESSRRFTTQKDINKSAPVAAGITHELFYFRVPAKAKMQVTNFANYINVFEAWGLIKWILKRNGIPIYPYHELTDQIAFGAPLRELAGVEISGGDKFSVDVYNGHEDVVKIGVALKYEIWEGF
ncbi:hypothetical protein ES703_67339 [subsurface metagenome]